jgi:hypothetical protein
MATLLPLVNPGSAAQITALTDAISTARLSTYLRRSHGNVRRALDLYEWNIRAGAALYPILHVNEVALRNTINGALVSQFGADWPYARGFLRSLPGLERTTFEKCIRKLENTLRKSRVSTDDVVAAQTYWFWVTLLTARFEKRIWSREFAAAFPSAPARVDRESVHVRADTIRRLRNRIAHWEPLLDVDLAGAYQRVASVVRWVSPETAVWMAERWPLPPDVLARP